MIPITIALTEITKIYNATRGIEGRTILNGKEIELDTELPYREWPHPADKPTYKRNRPTNNTQ